MTSLLVVRYCIAAHKCDGQMLVSLSICLTYGVSKADVVDVLR